MGRTLQAGRPNDSAPDPSRLGTARVLRLNASERVIDRQILQSLGQYGKD